MSIRRPEGFWIRSAFFCVTADFLFEASPRNPTLLYEPPDARCSVSELPEEVQELVFLQTSGSTVSTVHASVSCLMSVSPQEYRRLYSHAQSLVQQRIQALRQSTEALKRFTLFLREGGLAQLLCGWLDELVCDTAMWAGLTPALFVVCARVLMAVCDPTCSLLMLVSQRQKWYGLLEGFSWCSSWSAVRCLTVAVDGRGTFSCLRATRSLTMVSLLVVTPREGFVVQLRRHGFRCGPAHRCRAEGVLSTGTWHP